MARLSDATSAHGRRLLLTLPELWAVLAVLLPIVGALLATISTVDLAYHVRAGGIILDRGTLPSPDAFTFTAGGQPWVDQQWAAQVALAVVHQLGGWSLLAVLRAGLVGLVALLVFRACRSAGAGTRVAAWLALAGFGVGMVALGLRPQLLGMVLFALTLTILAGRHRRQDLLWAIPIVVMVWANVHGSFFLGPVAVIVAAIQDAVEGRPGHRRVLAIALISLGTSFVSPYGPAVWTYAVGIAADPTIRRLITEWQPTSPLSFAGAAFYASVGGVVVFLAVVTRRAGPGHLRRAWPTVAWLILLAAIGAFAERGVAWWSIAAPVAVAELIGRRPAAGNPVTAQSPSAGVAPASGSLIATGIVGILIVAMIGLLPVWRGGDALYGPNGLLTDAPRAITETVLAEAKPGDRIWNAQRWGSWLEFAAPAATVAVDSRIELIPAAAWADHLALSSGASNWAAILDHWDVQMVVASTSEQEALIPLLRVSQDWHLARDDPDGVVFVRVRP
ncbi:MAG: hypothetical protein ABI628_00705 [Chloroflexota bacterium]